MYGCYAICIWYQIIIMINRIIYYSSYVHKQDTAMLGINNI